MQHVRVQLSCTLSQGFLILYLRFRVTGLGFRVSGFWFWVNGLGFMVTVESLGFRVQGLRILIQDLGCRVQGLWFRIQSLGFLMYKGSTFKVQGLGFRVQGLGFSTCYESLPGVSARTAKAQLLSSDRPSRRRLVANLVQKHPVTSRLVRPPPHGEDAKRLTPSSPGIYG